MLKYILLAAFITYALAATSCTDDKKGFCQECESDTWECNGVEYFSEYFCVDVNKTGTDTYCSLPDKICSTTDDEITLNSDNYNEAGFTAAQDASEAAAKACNDNNDQNGKCCPSACTSKDECYCPQGCDDVTKDVQKGTAVIAGQDACYEDCLCCLTADACESQAGYAAKGDKDCCKVGCGDSSASSLSSFWF